VPLCSVRLRHLQVVAVVGYSAREVFRVPAASSVGRWAPQARAQAALEDSFQLPPAFLAHPAQRVPQLPKGLAVVRCLCLEVPLVLVLVRLRLCLRHSLLSERLRHQHSLRSERLRLGHRLRLERLRHSLRSERLHLRLPHSPHLLSVPAPPSALLLKRHRRPLLEAEVRQQGPFLGSRAVCSRALSSARRRAVASSARPPARVRPSLAPSVRGAVQVARACLASLQVFNSHRPLCSASRVLPVRPLSANLRKEVLSLSDSRAQASPRLRVLSVSGSSHNNRTPCNRAPWPSEVRCPLEQQLVRSERHLLLQMHSVAVLLVSRKLLWGVLAQVVARLEVARPLPVAPSELLGVPPLLEHLRSMQAQTFSHRLLAGKMLLHRGRRYGPSGVLFEWCRRWKKGVQRRSGSFPVVGEEQDSTNHASSLSLAVRKSCIVVSRGSVNSEHAQRATNFGWTG